MKIFYNKKIIYNKLKEQKNLGFVPTMGAIHKAHLSLIKKSNKLCKKTIVTIFINKPQFNKIKDFNKYPRNFKKDIKILKKNNVDYLYIPKNRDIYPRGPSSKIKIHKFSKQLCGKYRPNHFKAVVDVIDRFINIIKPSKIFLGKKDYQQLKIIEEFILRKGLNVKVIPCKTIREKNGVPYSSRNNLLSKKEKLNSSKIFKYISKNKYKIINKNINLYNLKKEILNFGAKKVEYIKVLNVNNFFFKKKKNKKYKIFLSYYINNVRLIDNI